jgi:2,3-diketo-5-methylthiopentyl-1-phosphate enolase
VALEAADAIVATYRLVARDEPMARRVAEEIASGQTVAARPEHRAAVVDLAAAGPGVFRASVAFPRANVEADLATVLVMVYGKVSLAPGIRLVDLALPRALLDGLPGPRFGIAGVRARAGVSGRPLTMSIFKPALGAAPSELAAVARDQALGGIDIVKDDEILPDLHTCRTVDRLAAVREAIAGARRAGAEKEPLYAVTLTGRANELCDRAADLVRRGATALLFSPLAYGISLLEALARDPRVSVPIVAHPALAGGIGGAVEVGIAYGALLGTVFRAAGADVVLYPSAYGKPALPEADARAVCDALRRPLGNLRAALPGPSAGVHPGMVPRIVADHGIDVLVNAGSGVHGHPGGARAGARAFRQAIDLALEDKSLTSWTDLADAPELGQALAKWGTA